MIDMAFFAQSAADFMDDLDQLCDDLGFPRLPLTDDEGVRRLPPVCITGTTRIDFDVRENLIAIPAVFDGDGNVVTPAVTRGWHVNIRMSEAYPEKPTGRYAQVAGAVLTWFIPQVEEPLGSPEEVKHTFGVEDRVVPTTVRNSKLIDPAPTVPKMRWYNGD